jgi:hypothetical protein
MINPIKQTSGAKRTLGIVLFIILSQGTQKALALPPAEDIPEEILRTEIITEGRSPLDGQALSATDYAELKKQIAQRPYPPEIEAKLQNLIFLLQIRKLFTTFTPL